VKLRANCRRLPFSAQPALLDEHRKSQQKLQTYAIRRWHGIKSHLLGVSVVSTTITTSPNENGTCCLAGPNFSAKAG
jgi:hypothetical protein